MRRTLTNGCGPTLKYLHGLPSTTLSIRREAPNLFFGPEETLDSVLRTAYDQSVQRPWRRARNTPRRAAHILSRTEGPCIFLDGPAQDSGISRVRTQADELSRAVQYDSISVEADGLGLLLIKQNCDAFAETAKRHEDTPIQLESVETGHA